MGYQIACTQDSSGMKRRRKFRRARFSAEHTGGEGRRRAGPGSARAGTLIRHDGSSFFTLRGSKCNLLFRVSRLFLRLSRSREEDRAGFPIPLLGSRKILREVLVPRPAKRSLLEEIIDP